MSSDMPKSGKPGKISPFSVLSSIRKPQAPALAQPTVSAPAAAAVAAAPSAPAAAVIAAPAAVVDRPIVRPEALAPVANAAPSPSAPASTGQAAGPLSAAASALRVQRTNAAIKKQRQRQYVKIVLRKGAGDNDRIREIRRFLNENHRSTSISAVLRVAIITVPKDDAFFVKYVHLRDLPRDGERTTLNLMPDDEEPLSKWREFVMKKDKDSADAPVDGVIGRTLMHLVKLDDDFLMRFDAAQEEEKSNRKGARR